MPEVGHVVVIGGGAAGCATAYYLSADGARVTIVEREGVGSQASGWSPGGLTPLQGMPEPIAALALESHRLHLDLWPELDRLTGRALGGRIISMAHLALDEAMIPALQDVQRCFEAAEGSSAEWLGPAAFRTLEPRITADIAGAVMTRGNGVVDSYLFTATLSEAAQRLGATLAEGTVTGIQHADRRVSGVVLEDRVIACDAVVVAMGPWSQAVEAWLDVPLPIVPLKGEIVRLALGGPPLPFDIVTSDVSLFSRGDDQVWLASPHELRGFDREPSQEA